MDRFMEKKKNEKEQGFEKRERETEITNKIVKIKRNNESEEKNGR